jgi:hypothetical protein
MMATQAPTVRTVLFIREAHFYPIQLSGAKPAAEEAADHAALNPGTLRIEDALTGEVLWPEGTKQ